jgi:hypothetical protein
VDHRGKVENNSTEFDVRFADEAEFKIVFTFDAVIPSGDELVWQEFEME